ncbi:MAG: retroviral-like aspartic protease family protein [Candidatus Omnitrophica bacterium]|nr:retroviral-like aspartic protease family protein [Candidatus Omnitrophota bacterium]
MINYFHKYILVLAVTLTFVLTGCGALRTTGRTAKTIGKVGWKTAKVTGKVAYKTGEVAYKTGKVTSKVVRTAVYMAKGKQIIPLEKYGNSLYTTVKINKKAKAKLLIDTGASKTQISRALARKLGVNLNKGDPIMASLANGAVVSGREVVLKEVRLNNVRVTNVKALVLDVDMDDDDGLLGMSFLNHFVFQIDVDKPELILQQKAK